MEPVVDIGAVDEMRRYAGSFFSARRPAGRQPGQIGWVLHLGYDAVADKRYRGYHEQGVDLPVSYVSAFVSPATGNGERGQRRQLLHRDLADDRYGQYMSPADQAVVQAILQQEKAEWAETGLFPVTQGILEKLCDHPNLYIAELKYCSKRVWGRPAELERLETSAEAISLQLCEPRPRVEDKGIFISVSMAPPRKGPTIQYLRKRQYAVFRETARSRKLARFLNEVGIGGELHVSAESAQLLRQFLDLFGVVRGDGDLLLRKHGERPAPFIRLTVTLYVWNRRLGGQLRVNPVLRCEQPPEPGKGEQCWRDTPEDEEVVMRDFDQELARRSCLLEHCPTLAAVLGENENDWNIPIGDEALEIIAELGDCPAELVSVEWRWIERKLEVERQKVKMHVHLMGGSSLGKEAWVGMSIQGEDSRKMTLFRELFTRMQREKRAALKKPGKEDEPQVYTLLSPTVHLLSRLALVEKAGKGAQDMQVKISRAGALLMGLASPGNGAEEELQGLDDLTGPILQEYRAAVPAVEGVQATLRPYQQAGYEWMQHLLNCGCGACLADEMGLGKTLQILCVLQARAAEGPSLVVAPASVVGNWAAEAARFTPRLRVLVPGSTREYAGIIREAAAGDVVLVSYTLLQNSEKLQAGISWNVAVLDEAQNIKNPLSARSRVAHALQAACRIAATGTPVENNMGDLWSIFQFINPDLLGSYVAFRSSKVNESSRGRLLSPFILRRTKKEVLTQFPAKKEKLCRITLSVREKELYESYRQELRVNMLKTDWLKELLPGLQRLRRMCCHPLLGYPDCNLPSAKLEHLRKMSLKLRKKGHKTLVFSQFTDMLALVRKMCDAESIPYCYLDGSTPMARRRQEVESFQNGDADFFLISLKAGGTGLNLTAADTVIILDPWWNPAVEEQAADRAHRIGQQRDVTVYRFVCRDTIEEKVLELQEDKHDMISEFLQGSRSAKGLTLQELRALL